jgi:tetratricopeptide (TPR) repeat protein
LNRGFRTAEVYNNLGHLYLDRNQLVDAQHNLNCALEINPELGVAHYNQAVLCYRQALDADPKSLDGNRSLEKGILHFRRAGQITSGSMAFVGATLCACAAAFDERWTEPALTYLAEAIDKGIKPQAWQSVFPFTHIKDKPGFQALLSRIPSRNHLSIASVCVVEPDGD